MNPRGSNAPGSAGAIVLSLVLTSLGALLGLAMLSLVGGCGRVSVTFRASTTGPKSWRTPVVADYAAFDSTASLSGAPANYHSDFRVSSDASSAAFVGSLFDGANYRAYGRIYSPYSLYGSGWASAGSLFAVLDDGTTDIANVAVGYSTTGSVLAAFGDGLAPAQNQSAGFASGGSWGSLTSSIGAVAVTGVQSTHGYTSSVTWDSSGVGYWGYVGATGVPYVKRYTAFSAWDSGTGTVLGAGAVQMELVNDGLGVTALWRTQVPFTRLAVGQTHSCALSLNNNELKCWGYNEYGQLGNGVSVPGTSSSVPVSVLGLESTAIAQVAVGVSHSCALTSGGEVKCWGRNNAGQLGNGATLPAASSSLPVGVTGLTGASAIASGDNHTCAIVASGAVKCWGENTDGQLGDGTSGTNQSSPVDVTGLTAITGIAGGASHTCAITSTGGVKCWGKNDEGQLGNSAALPDADQTSPVDVTGLANVIQIAAGGGHSCALNSSAGVKCWGNNAEGELGRADALPGTDSSSIADVDGLTAGVAEVVAGAKHACARLTDGTAKCWGSHEYGQLGNTTTSLGVSASTGATVTSLSSAISLAPGGAYHGCAVTSAGTVNCWGRNLYGQLGKGGTIPGTDTSAIAAVSNPVSCPAGSCLFSAWSQDSDFAAVKTLNSGTNVRAFASASDDSGNVVAVYIQDMSPAPTCSSITGCVARLFGSVRGAIGTWAGSNQLDTDLTDTVTSFYQDSSTEGGIDYPSPGIVHLGSGRFLMVYAINDHSVTTAKVTRLRARGYTVGSGWDSSTTTIESASLASSSSGQYRMINDLRLVSDGAGNALLILHYVSTNSDTPGSRKLSFKTYRYNSSTGWSDGYVIDSTGGTILECPATTDNCDTMRAEGAIFSTGEAVVVFPAPIDATASKMRLYSVEYR